MKERKTRSAAARLVCLLMLNTCCVTGARQVSAPTGLYRPPTQRSVPMVVADGVLMTEGSVANSSAAAATHPFVVDSAATASIVDPAIARALGSMGRAGERLQNKTIRLAGAEMEHKTVLVYSMQAYAEDTGEAAAGIVGADLLRRLAARIDYGSGLLTLLPPETCALPADRINIKTAGGLPFVEATLTTANGKEIKGVFLLDTGQSGPGLILTSEFLAAHPEELSDKASRARLPLLDANGSVRTTDLLRLPTLALGAYALHGVIASVAAPAAGRAGAGLAGVIGGGVLRHWDVLLDLPQAALTLTRNQYFAEPFEVDMSGMLLLRGEHGEHSGESGYMVAGIAESSPAADAGLQKDDRLLEVDHKQVTDMAMDLVRGMFKSGPGAKVLVTVDRAGRKFQVTLTLRRAL